MMYTILFVCTGNTCRSPMAEAILRKKLIQKGLEKEFDVHSAGLAAECGGGASECAQAVMQKLGVSLGEHQAKQVQKEDVQKADLVLAMTASHKQMLLHIAPAMSGKIFTVNEYAGEAGDVSDPYGGSEEVYGHCAELLNTILEKVLVKLESIR